MLNNLLKRNGQAGFTLVEIAIVMVIIGLLIGGVLKGQAMVQNAKVKRVVKQADELRASVMTFYDKYAMYPGDENSAAFPPAGSGVFVNAVIPFYEFGETKVTEFGVGFGRADIDARNEFAHRAGAVWAMSQMLIVNGLLHLKYQSQRLMI